MATNGLRAPSHAQRAVAADGGPTTPTNSMRRTLVNMGNTCYVNAVLQILSHSDVFVPALKAAVDAAEGAASTAPLAVARNLLAVLLALRVPLRHERDGPLAPQALVQAVARACPAFARPLQQHDAHEWFSTIIDTVSTELTACCGRLGQTRGGQDGMEGQWELLSQSQSAGERAEWARSLLQAWGRIGAVPGSASASDRDPIAVNGGNGRQGERSFLRAIHGTTTTVTRCANCNAQSYTADVFTSLCVPLPEKVMHDESTHTCRVSAMLNALFRDEMVEGRSCDTCNAKCSAGRRTTVWTLPDALVVTFKSSIPDLRPNKRPQIRLMPWLDVGALLHPASPERAESSPSVLETTPHNPRQMYRLKGVICHIGSMSGGHYVSAGMTASHFGGGGERQSSNPAWFAYDDERVMELGKGLRDVPSSTVYMALYERCVVL